MSGPVAEHLVTVLFVNRQTVRAACRYFDTQGSGRVHKDEFLLVLQALNAEIEESGLHFSQDQLEDLCEAIADADNADSSSDNAHSTGKKQQSKGGANAPQTSKLDVVSVPYEDFFDAFQIVDSSNIGTVVEMKHHT